MSKQLENLETKYLNKLYLLDDFDVEGVIYTNYKKSIMKKWIALFKTSKHCTVYHDPPKKLMIDYKGKDEAVKNLLKNVNIPEATKKRLNFFPEYVVVHKECKFDLLKFVEYLKKRKYDFEFLTRAEHDKDSPPEREKLFKTKKKKWH